MPAPYSGRIIELAQPDGSTVKVRGWGNQFAAMLESLDGYAVLRNPTTGFICYATLSNDQTKILPTEVPVREHGAATLAQSQQFKISLREAREALSARAITTTKQNYRWATRRREQLARSTEQATHVTGTITGLCVLVEFPDSPQKFSREQVDAFCNGVGNTTRPSVLDYFRDVSRSKLIYKNIVTNYIKAPKPLTHYDDPSLKLDVRSPELVNWLLQKLQRDNFDFSGLSVDSANHIYALNVFFAGKARTQNRGLWPHQKFLSDAIKVAPNRIFFDYQVTDMSDHLPLATFCHENGHMVCSFPDLYGATGRPLGIGGYCLMSKIPDTQIPLEVGGYLKHEAGWASNIVPVERGKSYTLKADDDTFLVHRRPNSNEYFLLEHRKRANWDQSLDGEGIVVWRVDDQASTESGPDPSFGRSEAQKEKTPDFLRVGRPILLLGASLGKPEDLLWSDATRSDITITSLSKTSDEITIQTR